jgi:hypothetical protein
MYGLEGRAVSSGSLANRNDTTTAGLGTSLFSIEKSRQQVLAGNTKPHYKRCYLADSGPPVEACIALSILLLASEILRSQRGESSLTATWPWAVAFLFGLLHGLGFASALIDIGLPQGDVPVALLAFNIGVEVGQLAFIAAVLGVMQLAKQFRIPDIVESRLRTATAYGVGTVAAFLFVERLAGFWA